MTRRLTFGFITLALFLGTYVLYTVNFGSSCDSSVNLIFRSKVGGAKWENELNTFEGYFQKDMVTESPAITNISLTQKDLNRICMKINTIGFFSYPQVLDTTPKGPRWGELEPYTNYYLEVQIGTRSHSVRWTDRYTSNKMRYHNLMEISRLIWDIIESTPEYQQMPKPSSGYL